MGLLYSICNKYNLGWNNDYRTVIRNAYFNATNYIDHYSIIITRCIPCYQHNDEFYSQKENAVLLAHKTKLINTS